MADDPNNPNPTEGQPVTPASDPNKPQKGAPAANPQADTVKLAEELGMVRKENETLKQYQDRVDPFIQTLWSDSVDQATRDKLVAAHNKRLGITPQDDGTKPNPTSNEPAKPSAMEVDNRNAHIKSITDKFSSDHGIVKLDKEKQTDINNRVGLELREMLDPMGNKTMQQIMETVSVTKLPQYLEKAWFLATRSDQIAEAKNEGRQEANNEGMGVIGSIPSSSVNPDETVLSNKEKEIAQKQGISEEKYLANKKEILKRDGQLF